MHNKTRENIVLCGTIVGIAVGVLSIYEKLGVSNILPFKSSPTIEILNLLVLIFFFFGLKPKKLVLDNHMDLLELTKRLGIEDPQNEQILFNGQRVNRLVSQICTNLIGYISLLILFYLIILLKDVDIVTYSKWNAPYPYLDFFAVATNAGSACYLYLSFAILYNITLDDKNKTSSYYKGPLMFLGVFILSYAVLLGYFPTQQDRVTNFYKLLCGLYNGWAMILLFGRITAMEFYFKDLTNPDHGFWSKVYKVGVSSLLPMYALSQPMYAILEFPQFTNQADIFKSIVFLVCFIGKGFFLLFVNTRIRNRLLHAYLHLNLANYSRSRSFIGTIFDNNEHLQIHGLPGIPPSYKLTGKYEYTCKQRGGRHSHGGTCTIRCTDFSRNIIEWRVSGVRNWTEEEDGVTTLYDCPYSWESTKGVIFSDDTYIYAYHINLETGAIFGFSRGTVIISDDRKEVLGFRGNYYQQSGNKIVWGTENIKKMGDQNGKVDE